MNEMVWKHVAMGGRWGPARTASTGVDRTRPVMALPISNCTLSSLLVMIVDSQGAQVGCGGQGQ